MDMLKLSGSMEKCLPFRHGIASSHSNNATAICGQEPESKICACALRVGGMLYPLSCQSQKH